MANQAPEIVSKYEVLFAIRTGVTVLLPKQAAFDGETEASISFTVDGQDVVIATKQKPVIIKGMQKNHLEAALSRGFIMFYETKDDDVVRSMVCHLKKSK